MHWKSPFQSAAPNYRLLAKEYPSLCEYLDVNGDYNFGNQAAVRLLNEILAHKYFGLSVHIPPPFLCPTIANRVDYLLYGQDLVKDIAGPINVIDIGCGASCIYPLLGCKLFNNWNFFATEIDLLSVQLAKDNIKRNELDNRIILFPITDQSQDLLSPLSTDSFKDKAFHLVICNPPFYCSKEDIVQRREAKGEASLSSFEYTENESIYPGGEVAFISRIIQESFQLRSRCVWYTSLVGSKSSLIDLEGLLIAQNNLITNYRIFSSSVGNTKRWILAWTFDEKFSGRGRGQKRRAIELQCAEIILKESPKLSAIISIFDDLEIYSLDDYFVTECQLWGRRARRSGVGVPLQSPLKFRLVISGLSLQFHLIEGEWESLISLLNYTKTIVQTNQKQ